MMRRVVISVATIACPVVMMVACVGDDPGSKSTSEGAEAGPSGEAGSSGDAAPSGDAGSDGATAIKQQCTFGTSHFADGCKLGP